MRDRVDAKSYMAGIAGTLARRSSEQEKTVKLLNRRKRGNRKLINIQDSYERESYAIYPVEFRTT